MRFPLFIAFRYFKARRSRHIINWISRISVAGITLGTMALVIILSVFNGLDHLIRSLFSSFDPDIRITAVEGKSFILSSSDSIRLNSVPGIALWSSVVEENALLRYRDRQAVATVKGVGTEFPSISGIDTMLIDGEFRLYDGEVPMGVIGQELAAQLGIGLNFINPVHVYVPRRTDKIILNPSAAITQRYLFPSGVFAIQQEYDSKYFVVPLAFARDLFSYRDGEVTAIEASLTPGVREKQVVSALREVFKEEFKVAGRLEQHAEFYRVMKAEKWAIFLILGFILLVASFNTISSLTLLMLEKKPDMQIIQSLGARKQTVRQIFLWEGLLVTGVGMAAGILLGTAACLAQQYFGLIRFPSTGSFVVDAYPVKLIFSDFFLVILMVGIIGLLAAWIPLRFMRKTYFSAGPGDG